MIPIEVRKVHTLTGHKDCLYTLATFDKHQFLSAGGDGMVVLWDMKQPETGQMIVKIPASVYALDYNKEKNLLVVGQNFSGIHLIDVNEKKEVGSIKLTKSSIFDIKTTQEAIYVATGDGELLKVNWELMIISRQQYATQSARSIAVHPNKHELAVGYSDHQIRILNASDLSIKKEIAAHEISVFTTRYHPKLPLLLSGSRDARIKLWDIGRDYQMVEEVAAHMYAINHLEFSPDGKHFATCSMDKSIKIWDATTIKLLKVIDKGRHAGHGTSVNKLLWMDYQNWLVSCSDDRTISIWDINFAQ